VEWFRHFVVHISSCSDIDIKHCLAILMISLLNVISCPVRYESLRPPVSVSYLQLVGPDLFHFTVRADQWQLTLYPHIGGPSLKTAKLHCWLLFDES